MNRSFRIAPLALLLTAAVGLHAAGPEYRYERDVDAGAAGWVRFRLPLEVLDRLASRGDDMALVDSGGRPVPLLPWSDPREPEPTVRQAPLVDVRAEGGGWWVSADLGPSRLRHRRVTLEVPGTGLAENVTVEGSPDGASWRTLARGSIFRLAPGGGSAKTSLEYSPTEDRYIRLFWPGSAGFPRWRQILVEDWPDRGGKWVADPVGIEPAPPVRNEGRYRLSLPSEPLPGAALILEVEIAFPVRARVLAGAGGEWRSLSESVLLPGRPPVLGLPAGAFQGPVMLTLDAAGFTPPALQGASLRYPPRYLLFNAPAAGTYTLRYGAAAPGPSGMLEGLPEPPARFVDASLGPPRELALPDLPAPSLAMGAAVPDVPFAAAWSVESRGAGALRLARLDLPLDLYGVARRDLGDVRLASEGMQVPYVVFTPPEGREVLNLQGLHPEPSSEGRHSEVVVDLPSEGLPLTALEVSTPAVPFTRRVSLQALVRPPAEAGVRGKTWRTLDSAWWTCPSAGDLPARLRLDPGSPVAARRLRLLFEDGDNAPLASVDLVLYARSHELLFPWPASGRVTLLAGAPALPAPVYDMAAFGDTLAGRPAAAARVAGPASPPRGGSFGGSPFWRWALLAAVGVAVLAMLVVLARSLKAGEGQNPRT